MGTSNLQRALCACLFSWGVTTLPLSALSLQEGMEEALSHHPKIQERLYAYKATLEDVRMSEAGYLPAIDYTAYLAEEKTDSTVFHRTLFTYEHSLQVTQNLFNGFGTLYEVEYQKARMLAAAHAYLVTTNDIAYQFVQIYNHVLEAQESVLLAKERVAFQQKTRETVGKLSIKYGKKMDSEVEKTDAAFFLAESNYVVAQNHLEEKLFNLERIIGRSVEASHLQTIVPTSLLPKSYEESLAFSKLHHPSVLVSQYALQAANAKHQGAYKGYYPKIDAYLRQSWSEDTDGVVGNEEQRSAGIQLSFNVYKGGADEAQIEKNLMGVMKEEALHQELLRKLDEQNRLSWSTKTHLTEQLHYLEQYVTTSRTTQALYEEEYTKGRRSLLDLLVAHNEYISAKTQKIKTEHERLFAEYRILDAMGSMVQTILGAKALSYTHRVAL